MKIRGETSVSVTGHRPPATALRLYAAPARPHTRGFVPRQAALEKKAATKKFLSFLQRESHKPLAFWTIQVKIFGLEGALQVASHVLGKTT
jgi:hypothetical protein